jgi:hypothetical protein
MQWTLHLWVEGPTDAQTSSDHSPRGVLPGIIWNALRELSGQEEESFEQLLPKAKITASRLSEHVSQFKTFAGGKRQANLEVPVRKMLLAFQQARQQDPHSIVVAVRDEDGQPHPRLHRSQIQEELSRQDWDRMAFGLCIKSVEAWLLADARAFETCFGKGPSKALPRKPEEDKDPKSTVRDLVNKHKELGEGTAELFGRLASCIDLATLAKACPDGFGSLREDLKRFIVPCLLK